MLSPVTQVNLVAGEILTLFEDIHSPLTIKEIEFYLDENEDMVCLALDFLLNRGIIHSEKYGEDLFIWMPRCEIENPMECHEEFYDPAF